jgi:Alginate lyase
MTNTRLLNVGLGLVLLAGGCAGGGSRPDPPGLGGGSGGSDDPGGTGGTSGNGGTSGRGGATGGSGGAGGTGGASGSGGAGGSSGAGGMAADAAPRGDGATDAAPPAKDASTPGGPPNYGGVGELVLVPLKYTDQPTPPIIAPECQDDPTQGFTEYQDSFVVQRPRNLPASDRFKYENGIYSFFVQSSDQPHKPNNTTAPRTEARYSDVGTGEHIFSADVMFESPSRTCIFQIHNVNSPIAIYLRVEGDRMFNLSTGKTILTGQTGKWFNLKVAFNIQTRQVRTFVNNCLKETSSAPNTASVNLWYFKHGTYTCDSGTCRSNYKNIHLYQKGSTDKFNTKSMYP